MQIAVRSGFTAGVVLLGASAVIAAPMAPQVPAVHLPSAAFSAVQLAALPNPLTQWEQIISEAVNNTKNLAIGVIADPVPILSQVVKNQLASLSTLGGAFRDFLVAAGGELRQTPGQIVDAVQQLFSGQISAAFATAFQAVLTPILVPIITTNFLLDVQSVIAKPVQNVLNVINTAISSPSGTGWLLSAGFPLISVISDMVSATGDSLQNVFDAVKGGNLIGALGAVLAIPGTLVGTVLNGYNGSGGGLLGPYGVVQGLRTALITIANAIAPPPVAEPDAATLPSASAAAVTLSPHAVAAAAGTSKDVSAIKRDRRAHNLSAKAGSVGDSPKDAGDDATSSPHKTGSHAKKDRSAKNSDGASSSGKGGRHAHAAAH